MGKITTIYWPSTHIYWILLIWEVCKHNIYSTSENVFTRCSQQYLYFTTSMAVIHWLGVLLWKVHGEIVLLIFINTISLALIRGIMEHIHLKVGWHEPSKILNLISARRSSLASTTFWVHDRIKVILLTSLFSQIMLSMSLKFCLVIANFHQPNKTKIRWCK